MKSRAFWMPMFLLLLLAGLLAWGTTDSFEIHFTDGTMRVDFFHSGTATEEHISLDGVVADGPWPGSRTRLHDELNLGKYLFEVVDPSTNRILFSQGFSSIYGEWETTGEAKKVWRTFHESLRFPWPRHLVQVRLSKRDDRNLFREIWTTAIDPNSRFVNPAVLAPKPRGGKVWTLLENGSPAEKVDLLLLGDGYTAEEMEKFHTDARRLADALFTFEPFRSRKGDFNVRAIDLPAAEAGVSRPHAGVFRRTPLSAHYSSFDTERYVLTYDNRAVRDVASAAPYDYLAILVNERTYGGGGIFRAQATNATGSAESIYLFVHEFGHHFADLADEYYTSDVAYETGVPDLPEPYEPNVTALHDPATLKWKDLVEPGTPLPTPWDKEAYEKHSRAVQEQRRKLRAEKASEEQMEKLFNEQRAFETGFFRKMNYYGKVGAFEGARYEAKGLYRPSIDCIMFSRNLDAGFCPVCRRALSRIIDHYTRP